MARKLTLAEVALADTTAKHPFNEPTEIVPVPTPEEMAVWTPDRDPTRVRYRKEVNVSTGEVSYYELTDDEYRARHVAKIISRNEYVARKRAEAEKAAHDADMEAMLAEWRAKRAPR